LGFGKAFACKSRKTTRFENKRENHFQKQLEGGGEFRRKGKGRGEISRRGGKRRGACLWEQVEKEKKEEKPADKKNGCRTSRGNRPIKFIFEKDENQGEIQDGKKTKKLDGR